MSNTLTKLSARVVVSETRVWVPGTSGNPAYCINVQSTVPNPGVWIYDPGNPATGRPAGYVYVPGSGTRTVVTTTCYPETPGTQGHYESTPNYGLDYQLGWSGAARSIDSLTGDGLYQFSVTRSSVGVVTGFNSLNEGASYVEIEHAIYAHSGSYQIMESGVAKTPAASFAAADVFTIARVGNQVRYYKGSTLLYVSARTSSGTVFADASLYAAGDQIVDASITATVGSFLPGSSAPTYAGETASENRVTGYLKGLTGYAANNNDASVGAGPAPGNPGNPAPGSPTPPPGSPTTGSVDPTTGDWIGRSGGTLRMLIGSAHANFYGNYNVGSVAAGSVPDPSGAGAVDPLTGDWPGRSGGVLRMLTGSAFGGAGAGANYAILSGRLTGLSGGGDANLIVPEFVIVDAVLGELSGFATALPGTAGSCTGYLAGLRGFASNTTGAYVGSGPPPNPTSDPQDPLTGDWAGRSGGTLRPLIGRAFDETWLAEGYENQGFLVLPRLRITGGGYTPSIAAPDGSPRPGYGFYGELPALTLAAYGGSSIGLLRLPKLRLSITGTITIIGGAALTLPRLRLTISATVTGIGGTPRPMRLPALELNAYGSGGGAEYRTAAGALHLPRLRLVGAATASRVATASLRLPKLRLAATAIKVTVATAALTLPALHLVVAGGTGAGALKLPRLTLRALAKAVVDLAYEAWSCTLMPQDDGEIGVASTHYTNYPFERIVRFRDHYYGVGVDAIYLLEGDDFSGEPIVADVETASEDFDRGNLKRLEALWFAGRCGADMQVAAISAELEEPVYYFSPDKMGARTQRVIFGRGTEARYWAIRFTNPAGENFYVEQATPEITVLKRTHGGPS